MKVLGVTIGTPTVDSILSSFTQAVEDLNALAATNWQASAEKVVRSKTLSEEAADLDDQAARASTIAKKITALVSSEV